MEQIRNNVTFQPIHRAVLLAPTISRYGLHVWDHHVQTLFFYKQIPRMHKRRIGNWGNLNRLQWFFQRLSHQYKLLTTCLVLHFGTLFDVGYQNRTSAASGSIVPIYRTGLCGSLTILSWRDR